MGEPLFAPLALLDRRTQSLGCARCGTCCEVITLGFDPRESVRRLEETPLEDREKVHGRMNVANAEFYAAHWTVEWVDDKDSYGMSQPLYVTTCDAYDADTRLCTLGDKRPPICAGYPHYETPPATGRTLDAKTRAMPERMGASCSYALDSPGWAKHGYRPLIPVEVIRG